MTELEMYELWCTLRLWANYNQLNQTIEKNWLSNSFNRFPGSYRGSADCCRHTPAGGCS